MIETHEKSENKVHSADQITPNIIISDAGAQHWFSQVTLRLRREIAWCWYQRSGLNDPASGVLPLVGDAALENLDLIRYENEKKTFYSTDQAAKFLTESINDLDAEYINKAGHWSWIQQELDLDDASQFVLALAMAANIDSALGVLFSTCMNDMSRPYPTLALAQRLWDKPLDIIQCVDACHPLYRFGLLLSPANATSQSAWLQPLTMHSMVVRQLMNNERSLPYSLKTVSCSKIRELDEHGRILTVHCGKNIKKAQFVPLLGQKDSPFSDWAATMGYVLKRDVVAAAEFFELNQENITALACTAWLNKNDVLYLERGSIDSGNCEKLKTMKSLFSHVQDIPIRWYLPITDMSVQDYLPIQHATPPLSIKSLTFSERVEMFEEKLGPAAKNILMAIEECARRFRFDERAISRVANSFADTSAVLSPVSLNAACANEAKLDLGNLASLVTPRFDPDELILAEAQTRTFNDILHAMKVLTVVHYHWGTASVWNEGGISVLFCGAPGTGKTMAAEALSSALSLPMYRIDLSQVVNKYIGETEKNLKKIFDAAETSDCILFFDEADALFGKRTEVKDAHDRFANIEISYLLERMERFKGLAILATNRRKDLDEAFKRRLRFVIDFPIPGINERKRIWKNIFPVGVDTSDLDISYLAKQFPLSGGYIRSIAFNACLSSATTNFSFRKVDLDNVKKITMPVLLVAIKQELEKMDRSADKALFGSYSELLPELLV